jgi:membrane associated rhomboid family serine protease
MIDDERAILRVANDELSAREWELVLLAQGFAAEMHAAEEGIVLTVPRVEFDGAIIALAAYEQESAPRTAPVNRPIESMRLSAGVVLGVFLLGFFALTVNGGPPWFERGSADAGGMLDGELWRSVTALTLHTDIAHALSNAVAISVFFGALAGLTGVGLGGLLILFAGAAGNFANSVVQGWPHDSVGASTAIFGAVGILGGLAAMRRRRLIEERRRAWIAIAAALALLGMLGTGGGRVDFWAHILGLIAGVIVGLLAGTITPQPPSKVVQWLCGFAACALTLGCWLLALR